MANKNMTNGEIAQRLRDAADGPAPPLNSFMDRTIGCWLGVNTPAWRAVIGWSTGIPAFLWLDTEAQRIALLLVACTLDG